MSQHTIGFTVNGQAEVLQVESRRLLCDALRDDLSLNEIVLNAGTAS
jgi:aerobic-type carbon monoxide dehydrogenase small subunit (CoxS/CutS family)